MKIAIIRFSSFGDILCTGPAVRSVKARFPEAEITYITSPAFEDLVKCLPGVDRAFGMEKRGDAYEEAISVLCQTDWDYIADLQGSPKSSSLVSQLKPKTFSTDTPPRLRRSILLYTRLKVGTFLPVPERMLESLGTIKAIDDGDGLKIKVPDQIIKETLNKYGELLNDTIVLVTGAKHKTKTWPGEYWLDLVRKIEKKHRILFIGSQGDVPEELIDYCKNNDRCEDLSGKTSILEAAAVLSLSKAVVTGDTGPMHMAVALGKPLVTIFGPTVEEFGFFPFRTKNCIILQKKMWCRPCTPHGSSFCWRGHFRCMKDIKPDEVFEALGKVLEGAEE